MNIKDVYSRVMNDSYTDEDLNWLLSDDNKFLNVDSFDIYFDIIKKLKINSEQDFINNFIDVCRNRKKNIISLIFRILLEDDEKELIINNLVKYQRFQQTNPKLANICLDKLKDNIEESSFGKLSLDYYQNLINKKVFEEMDDNEILKCLNCDYLYLLYDDCILELINVFGDNPLFKNKLIDFLKKYPDKKINLDSYNTLKHLISYDSIGNNVEYKGIKLLRFQECDIILKKQCGYRDGFDMSEVSIIKLYNYYYSKNKSNDMNDILSFWYGSCIIDDILKLKIDYENFAINIMRINNQIKLHLDFNEVEYHSSLLSQLDKDGMSDRIYIDFFGIDKEGIMTYGQYKKAIKFYDDISKEIKQYNFTPLEAYLYTCNKTHDFKTYKFYRDDEKLDQKYSQMSRNPFYIVNNEYIVCAGYVNFALEVLKRLDIPASYLVICSREIGYDDDDTHAQVLVHLKDPKYNVDGVYIGEVTGDKTKSQFYYHNAVLTKDRESYNKHQIILNAKDWFCEAMEKLDIPDECKDDRNDEFYDIINRPIPSNILSNALFNMFYKVNPNLNIDDIFDYFQFDALSNPLLSTYNMLKKRLKDMQVNNKCVAHLIDFNTFLCDKPNNHIKFDKIGCGTINNTIIQYNIVIKDKDKSKEDINNILLSNRYAFENEYVHYKYDIFFGHPGIQIRVPLNMFGEELKGIFIKATSSINMVLGNGILQDWYDYSNDKNSRRKR